MQSAWKIVYKKKSIIKTSGYLRVETCNCKSVCLLIDIMCNVQLYFIKLTIENSFKILVAYFKVYYMAENNRVKCSQLSHKAVKCQAPVETQILYFYSLLSLLFTLLLLLYDIFPNPLIFIIISSCVHIYFLMGFSIVKGKYISLL